MTKKRLPLIYVLPLTVAVILGVLAMLPPRLGVTKANFDRIKVGMNKSEIERVFDGQEDAGNINMWHIWHGPEGSAIITFSDQDIVLSKIWAYAPPENWFQRTCCWLHLR
jgi:hypothetical protein